MIDLNDAALFVRAITAGSLSAAGRELNCSPAVASKRLARLEANLGVRLIHRTSRHLRLTEEGAIFYERCTAILADMEEAEAAVTAGIAGPRGVLKVTVSVAFGRNWVGPCAAAFTRKHPGVKVELNLNDSVVDLIDGGFDVAVRIGAPEDSRLVSRRLVPNRRVICASPKYLKRRGTPQTIADLAQHDCLTSQVPGSPLGAWTLGTGRQARSVRVTGPLSADNGELIYDWALAGHGLAFKSVWDVVPDLASGRLVTVLDAYATESYDIHAVYPSRRFLPAKTRLFVQALCEELDAAWRKLPPGIGLPAPGARTRR